MSKIIVIGGGAAGMFAAGKAAENGHEVHIYEKNNKLGKKIYITGKGRCNITNDSDVDTFLNNTPGNPYFLYSAFYTFDSEKTIGFFNSMGVKTKVERGNRVFPVSDKASDVVAALEEYMKKMKVRLHLESPVKNLIIEDGCVKGIITNGGQKVMADGVIVTTGGLSYPGTGSTGDGYKFAKDCGHHVTPLYPSLVPLRAKEKWCADLMGLSLKNIKIVIKNNKGKEIYEDFGEMLFTHYGVSGPVILSSSRHLLGKFGDGIVLNIDLKPALDYKALDNRLLRDFEKYINKNFGNALDDLLPQKMVPIIIELSGISKDKKVHDITKEERKKLGELLKALPLSITGTSGYNEAVVTSGGIDVNEINPSTMESKLIKNLYFAGEILDLDAYTGGFNLQIAFSTGYVAGSNICTEE
ncbi:MAG TPA: aminoacetone oxidase family FAD-binding enzyme [Lachnospiraceae bacterium]|nr:aminoacetone oxidase family FAD-binding enzyme [Lachnospiraceae bacterium]